VHFIKAKERIKHIGISNFSFPLRYYITVLPYGIALRYLHYGYNRKYIFFFTLDPTITNFLFSLLLPFIVDKRIWKEERTQVESKASDRKFRNGKFRF
jgi:hypothetical protein